MSRASVLARGRAAAGASMMDSCLIERNAGEVNDSHGNTTTTWTEVYTGPCRVQEPGGRSAARTITPGEAVVGLLHRELHLPVDTSLGVRANDRVTVTTCVHDADLVGRSFFIRSEAAASEKTARRLGIEEVTG